MSNRILNHKWLTLLLVGIFACQFVSSTENITSSCVSEDENDKLIAYQRDQLIQHDKRVEISGIAGVKPTTSALLTVREETVDPFYYLDANLKDYFDLETIHDFSSGYFGNSSYTGEGVTVAVLNGGIAYDHPYFSKGYESITKRFVIDEEGENGTASSADYSEHATMCASLVKQIAPKADIISVGPDNDLTEAESIIGVFRWLLNNYQTYNIKIVSRSMSYIDSITVPSGLTEVENTIKYLSGNGPHPSTGEMISDGDEILFVFSSGNIYNQVIEYQIKWPGSLGDYKNIICVGRVDWNENKMNMTFGNDAIQNPSDSIKMECMTLGENLLSCSDESTIELFGGSSAATPIVAGALALAIEKYNTANPTTIENYIGGLQDINEGLNSINKPAPECYDNETFEIDHTLLSKYYGYGLLNIKGILNFTDSDNDMLTDFMEKAERIYNSQDVECCLNPWNPDTDGDLMLDGWELKYKKPFTNNTIAFDPFVNNNSPDRFGSYGDLDEDGLLNYQESIAFTNPLISDTDDDGWSDYYEVNNNLFPTINDANSDPDNDDSPNIEEYSHGTDPQDFDSDGAEVDGIYSTDPTKWDTDGDGYDDLTEILAGTSPTNASDYPGAGGGGIGF